MSKKMGRPKLPKDEAKGHQIGVRYNPQEAERVRSAAESWGQTQADWVREVTLREERNRPQWIQCNWKPEELDQKSVEFEILSLQHGRIKGGGILRALMRPDGKMRVEIESRFRWAKDSETTHVFYMPQEAVRELKKLPSGSRFDFSIKVSPNQK